MCPSSFYVNKTVKQRILQRLWLLPFLPFPYSASPIHEMCSSDKKLVQFREEMISLKLHQDAQLPGLDETPGQTIKSSFTWNIYLIEDKSLCSSKTSSSHVLI